MKETNTKQLINEPTRVTATSTTLLDHIVMDRLAEVMRTGVIDAPSILDHKGMKITDHRMVCCNIMFKKCKKIPKMISYRDFSKFHPNRAVTATAKVDWEKVTQLPGVNSIEKFITTHKNCVYSS
uniref:Endonuclease/exonuclease/phosphatase domain-containing protein n=1 Tax=Cuerna arida TaxID=1464854 RepID=A0A1B6GJV4_9HEMI